MAKILQKNLSAVSRHVHIPQTQTHTHSHTHSMKTHSHFCRIYSFYAYSTSFLLVLLCSPAITFIQLIQIILSTAICIGFCIWSFVGVGGCCLASDPKTVANTILDWKFSHIFLCRSLLRFLFAYKADTIWCEISHRFATIAHITPTLLSGIGAEMELDYFVDCCLCAVFSAWHAHVIGHSDGRIYEPVSWKFIDCRFVIFHLFNGFCSPSPVKIGFIPVTHEVTLWKPYFPHFSEFVCNCGLLFEFQQFKWIWLWIFDYFTIFLLLTLLIFLSTGDYIVIV